jgi:hypothetical protein
VDKLTGLLEVLTKENGIILVLILLLFIDRVKIWVTIIENAYRRWMKIDRKQANKNLEEYTLKVGKIHEILEVYRKSLNAARVGYYVLHNGGKDIRGIPFLKYSCMNEAVAYGVRSRLKIDKDLQISSLLPWTKNLVAGTPVISVVDTLPTNSVRDILEENLVTKCAIMPVYDDSLLAGFVAVEWKLEKYIPSSNEIIEEHIIQCAKLVEINSIKDINHFLSY